MAHNMAHIELEIVDQGSTRVTPPFGRGLQWEMGGLQLDMLLSHWDSTHKYT